VLKTRHAALIDEDKIVLRVKDNVVLKANSECVLYVFSDELINDKTYLFVPYRENLDKRFILSCESVGKGYENCVPCRIFNYCKEDVLLFKNTHVGHAEKINICVAEKETVRQVKNESKEKVKFFSKFRHGDLENNCLSSLLWKYRDVFSNKLNDIGCCAVEHVIETNCNVPVHTRYRRVPMHLEKEVDNKINELLEAKVIRPSTSSWSSPIVVVRKKTGEIRLCIDYRQLNEVTKRPIYPIPDSRSIFDSLQGNKFFSTIDLSSGYYQVPMNEKDKCKTAFMTKRGQYEFNRMPMGLNGAPATFQRAMNVILRELVWEQCVVYLDDVLVFGKTLEEHNKRLRDVLERFRQANLKLKPSKCSFLQTEIKYLGHIISSDGLKTDPSKISAVKNWPVPKTKDELHSFLGLCGYYRSFIKNFSFTVEPLQKLMVTKTFNWSKDEDTAFNILKTKLCTSPILALPIKTGKFILDTDASHGCIGAVLSQIQDGREHVIAYASNRLTKCQKNYCVTRKELLAAHHYIQHFKHYLIGSSFLLRSDHKALQWLLDWKRPNTSQYCLWKADLERFSFDIEHRKGSEHINADALSRIPQCGQCEIKHENPKERRNTKLINEEIEVKSLEEERVLMFKLEDRLAIEQQKDEELVTIKKWLHSEGRCNDPSGNKIILNKYGRLIFKKADNLRIKGDALYLLTKNEYKLIVPKHLKMELLRKYHEFNSHLGIKKCTRLLEERFYWPGMDVEIKDHINNCQLCQKIKMKNKRLFTNPKQIKSSTPFERICVDICGPFEQTLYGNKYILGIIDHFSKYCSLIPIKSQDAKTIAKELMNKWISKFGCPTVIMSDNGKCFTSDLIENLCKICNISQIFSAPYHQQANGLVERLFQTAKPLIKINTLQNHNEWDETLTSVELALRSSISNSTKYSPFEILFGQRIRLPGEGNINIEMVGKENVEKQLQERFEEIMNVRRKVEINVRNVGRTYEKKKYLYREIKIGELVLVKNFCIAQKTRFVGPYRIVERVGSSAYRMVCLRDGREIVRHYNDIKAISSKSKTASSVPTSVSQQHHSRHRENNPMATRYPTRQRGPVSRLGVVQY